MEIRRAFPFALTVSAVDPGHVSTTTETPVWWHHQSGGSFVPVPKGLLSCQEQSL